MHQTPGPSPDFSKQSLIPAVVQDAESLDVLMVAYMDQEAWEATINTGFGHYHSRSRDSLWKKGETSGHVQEVVEIRLDCDEDTILLKVKQTGPACHTGNRSCFYRAVSSGSTPTDSSSPDRGS
jgi:phosphoribosyl-AMP cyclohydrolase / phosphoribosyl-ATP pyrophosphohydrolase